MDPDILLEEIREIQEHMKQRFGGGYYPRRPWNSDLAAMDAADLGVELAIRVEALDEWLSQGGFLPRAWQH